MYLFPVTDGEYSRLSEAFSRFATHNSHITKQSFARDVLGELFPTRIADVSSTCYCNIYIYVSFNEVHRRIFFKEI